MDCAGYQLLASTWFAVNQYCRVSRSHDLDLVQYRTKRLATADDSIEVRLFTDFVVEEAFQREAVFHLSGFG